MTRRKRLCLLLAVLTLLLALSACGAQSKLVLATTGMEPTLDLTLPDTITLPDKGRDTVYKSYVDKAYSMALAAALLDMDADTMREFVSDIGNESDRLTRMTQKLLTLSKADAQTTCEHEVVDLGETVRRVFRMLVPLADRTQIQLTASLDRGCYVLSMEDDAYQIIFNLVENGIKYNHAGGSVHVTVRHTQDEAELLVEDTGMGIPQDAIEHIFERFYRVDKARSRQAGGSGLGLSIVHELVERNFGTIEVSSKEGEGTKFTVRMPYFELEEDDDDA